ncbi:MAG: hypothetical protein AAGI15_13105 [Pseudomonadota bacterium]
MAKAFHGSQPPGTASIIVPQTSRIRSPRGWLARQTPTTVRVPLPNMPLVRSAGLITRKEGFQRPITRAVEKTIRDFVIELVGEYEVPTTEAPADA